MEGTGQVGVKREENVSPAALRCHRLCSGDFRWVDGDAGLTVQFSSLMHHRIFSNILFCFISLLPISDVFKEKPSAAQIELLAIIYLNKDVFLL